MLAGALIMAGTCPADYLRSQLFKHLARSGSAQHLHYHKNEHHVVEARRRRSRLWLRHILRSMKCAVASRRPAMEHTRRICMKFTIRLTFLASIHTHRRLGLRPGCPL